jgi:hypothetical protein
VLLKRRLLEFGQRKGEGDKEAGRAAADPKPKRDGKLVRGKGGKWFHISEDVGPSYEELLAEEYGENWREKLSR